MLPTFSGSVDMALKKFKDWTPDISPLLGGTLTCYNTLPTDDGYVQMPVPNLVGPSGLPDQILALFVGTTADRQKFPIAMGSNQSFVYRNGAWDVIDGSIITASTWELVPYGDYVYAYNGIDPPQRIDLTNNATFVPIHSTDNVTGRYAAQVADVIMMADISGFGGTERHPFRVQWTGVQRPELIDPNPTIQSDYQDVTDIGPLRGISGGEYGLILGELGVSRADYVGPDAGIFQFATIETNTGCELPKTVVRIGDTTYWWSKRGWRASNGGPSQPVAAGICDKWFSNLVDRTKADKISRIILQRYEVILWSFVSRFAEDDQPDMALAFNWRLGRWTPGKFRCACLGFSNQPSFTTDDLISNLPFFDPLTSTTDDYHSFTDTFTTEDDFEAAVVDGVLASLNPQQGTFIDLETEELDFNGGAVSRLARVRPMISNCQDTRIVVGLRDNQSQDVWSNTDELLVDDEGYIQINERSRYFRILSRSLTPFDKALGIDIGKGDVRDSGNRL
jgi:hypothetical protein